MKTTLSEKRQAKTFYKIDSIHIASLEVTQHDGLNVIVLQLEDDPLPIAQHSSMHLTNGGAGDGLLIELLKDLLHGPPKLHFYAAPNIPVRFAREVVL